MRLDVPLCLLLLLSPLSATLFAQDTILFENKYPYLVNIVEEHERDVVFRKINLENSPTYIIEKRFVSSIGYKDPKAGKLKFKTVKSDLRRPLDVWVTPMDRRHPDKQGILHHLTDSTLVLKTKPAAQATNDRGLPAEVDILPYQQVHRLQFRRRNQVARFGFRGAVAGFAIGTTVGWFIFKDDEPCDLLDPDTPCDNGLKSPRTKLEKALLLGAGTGGLGFATGGLLGSVRVTIPVAGRLDAYNAAIPKIEKMGRVK